MTRTYEPEQEGDYTVNYWCWYLGTEDAPHILPPNLYNRLKEGTAGTFYRSYRTREEALADLENAKVT